MGRPRRKLKLLAAGMLLGAAVYGTYTIVQQYRLSNAFEMETAADVAKEDELAALHLEEPVAVDEPSAAVASPSPVDGVALQAAVAQAFHQELVNQGVPFLPPPPSSPATDPCMKEKRVPSSSLPETVVSTPTPPLAVADKAASRTVTLRPDFMPSSEDTSSATRRESAKSLGRMPHAEESPHLVEPMPRLEETAIHPKNTVTPALSGVAITAPSLVVPTPLSQASPEAATSRSVPIPTPTAIAPNPIPVPDKIASDSPREGYSVLPSGETLREISRKTLGSGDRWAEIYKLNPKWKPEEIIPGGTLLALPTSIGRSIEAASEPLVWGNRTFSMIEQKASQLKPLPYIGSHPCAIDDKNSLLLPGTVCDQVGKTEVLFLTPSQDCVWLTTSAGLKRYMERPTPRGCGEEEQRLRRLFFARTERGAIDETTARLYIPAHLAQVAGLRQDVVIVGVGNHFEIWDAQRWQQYCQLSAQEANPIAKIQPVSGWRP